MASKGAIKAGEGYVLLGVDAGPLAQGLKAASAQLQSWGKSIASIGVSVAAGGAAIAAPFLYGLSVLADASGQLSLANRQTGLGFEDLQLLSYGLKTDLEGLAISVKKMDVFLNHLANHSPEAQHALDQLGVSFESLRTASTKERLLIIGAALNNVADPATKAALAVQILGKQATSLNFGDVEARMERLNALGGITKPEDVAVGNAYNRAMGELGIVLKGLWIAIGATAAPLMTQWIILLTNLAMWVRTVVDNNRPLLSIIFAVADKVILLGGIIGSFGGVLIAAGLGLGGLAAAIPFIIVGVKVMAVGLLLLVGVIMSIGLPLLAFYLLLKAFPALAETVWRGFAALANWLSATWGPTIASAFGTLATAWSGVSDALSAGEFALAWDVAWTAIRLLWEQGINFMKDGWYGFKYFFLLICNDIQNAYRATMRSIRTAFEVNMPLAAAVGAFGSGAGLGPVAAPVLESADREAERQLQRDLENRQREAAMVAFLADNARRMGNPEQGPMGDLMGGPGGSAMGSFMADAIAGFGGADTPLDNVERNTRRQAELAQEILDRLNQMGGLRVA